MTTIQVKPASTSASYRALRVWWPVRWRLAWAARSDRRAGLPIGLSIGTTPVLRGLFARRDDVCERERTRYLTAAEPVEIRLAEIDAQLGSLRRVLPLRREEVARSSEKPSDGELSQRRAGELELPIELIRQRRTSEWERQLDAARAALVAVEYQMDVLVAGRAELETQRQHRADIARSRALRFCKHTDRLAAIYRRALIRRHRQRDDLIKQWQNDLCPPPAWVSSDELMPAVRLTGVTA